MHTYTGNEAGRQQMSDAQGLLIADAAPNCIYRLGRSKKITYYMTVHNHVTFKESGRESLICLCNTIVGG